MDARDGIEIGAGIHLDVRTVGTGPRTALVLPGAERTDEDEAFLAALSAEFTVVMPSHPGFGRSPRPSWCTSVDDLAYLYLGWLERTGFTDVTLIGLQFGGWVAMEMAVRSCARLSRLVLVDSVGVKLGDPTDREIADLFAASHADLDEWIYADPAFRMGELSQAPEDAVLEMARNEEALAVYGWQPYLHNPRLSHWLWQISVPTLVAWGARDGIVAHEYGRALADRFSDARFELIEDAGHRPQVEQPEQLAKLVLAADL
ncbi:alpha/beta fold hydrolase [Pseudonocardia thermophila]|uniref:alpha/beta fold hydrolase n=1 Tax=Pseudonocardia thermophila TaxID=1848 RepID=UPI001F362DDA|nr:alpha/beta hydrolase [Pseudonocardia thermophila]